MARPELGTKRTDPDTGQKFYDLGKDPIVSPFTGKTFSPSDFEDTPAPARAKAAPKTPKPDADEEETEEVVVEEAEDGVEVVSLEDAEEDDTKTDENLPDLGDDTDDETPDDKDVFLETDDDDDDDGVAGIAVGGDYNDDDT